MGKRAARWARSDIKTILGNLIASDEVVRADAVRRFYPCHDGWELFEQQVDVLSRLLRDPSDVVRCNVLHVFEDANEMHSRDELDYYLERGEKHASSHFRSMEQRSETFRGRESKSASGLNQRE